MWRSIMLGVAVLLAAGAAIWAYRCPCERVPGVWLRGATASAAVADWSVANQAGLCALQVQGTVIPHAITLNCMSADGALYVSCSRCEGKYWSQQALAIPAGRVRIGTTVYPVTLTRVTEPAQLDIAWAGRGAKLGGAPGPRPDHWWSFELRSR